MGFPKVQIERSKKNNPKLHSEGVLDFMVPNVSIEQGNSIGMGFGVVGVLAGGGSPLSLFFYFC